MSITKKVTFIANTGHIKEMKNLLKTMVEASKAEDGCLLYDIFQFADEPQKFIVIESWRDEKSLDGHKQSDHYKYYKSHFEPYCQEKFSDELVIL